MPKERPNIKSQKSTSTNTIERILILVKGESKTVKATFSRKYDLRNVNHGVIRHHGMAYDINPLMDGNRVFVACSIDGRAFAINQNLLTGTLLGYW